MPTINRMRLDMNLLRMLENKTLKLNKFGKAIEIILLLLMMM